MKASENGTTQVKLMVEANEALRCQQRNAVAST
jgi:guanylate kinase